MGAKELKAEDLISDFIHDYEVGQFDEEGNPIDEMIMALPASDYSKLTELINTCCGLVKKPTSEKEVLPLNIVTTRTLECQRCYTIYEYVEGEPPTTCVATSKVRTSGICGGELREVIA